MCLLKHFEVIMNRQDFRFPKTDVGEKLIAEFENKDSVELTCQDWEYTSAELKDLEKYIKRYDQIFTTSEEKRVLASLIFQASEDALAENYSENEGSVKQYLLMLSKDFEVTKFEFDYWSCWDTDEKENRFYISEITRDFNVRINTRFS